MEEPIMTNYIVRPSLPGFVYTYNSGKLCTCLFNITLYISKLKVSDRGQAHAPLAPTVDIALFAIKKRPSRLMYSRGYIQ